MDSALASPSSSRYSSREPSPIPIHHVQHVQPNPYRLPRFWRGVVVGGLGLYVLPKLGSFIWNQYKNKFNKSSVVYSTPTPKPTPTSKYTRHY